MCQQSFQGIIKSPPPVKLYIQGNVQGVQGLGFTSRVDDVDYIVDDDDDDDDDNVSNIQYTGY